MGKNSLISYTIMKNFISCHTSSVLRKKHYFQISCRLLVSGHLFTINRVLHSDHRGKRIIPIGVGAARSITFQKLPNKHPMAELFTTVHNSKKVIVLPCL